MAAIDMADTAMEAAIGVGKSLGMCTPNDGASATSTAAAR